MGPFGILRLLFLAAIMLCVWIVGAHGRWEGRLSTDGRTWIVHLARMPVWDPPRKPDYAQFRRDFDDLPATRPPGTTIRRVLKWDWMALDLLLYVWAISAFFGSFYVAVRSADRDSVLHCAFSVAAGLTVAAAVCIGLWAIFGGWGPPEPLFFGTLGLLGGIAHGVATYRRIPSAGSPQPKRSLDHERHGSA